MRTNVELYLGDCLDVMRKMDDKSIDVIITDPPYGIKRDKGTGGDGRFNGRVVKRRVYDDNWDQSRPGKEYFGEMLRIARVVLIFVGNYFADLLPRGSHWVVWDKLQTAPSFSDCELIWTNVPRNNVKMIRREFNGLFGRENERYHPTQKPLKVLTWLVDHYSEPGMTIFDPFMGSGSTGVAAVMAGRNFIGVELLKKYYDIARMRIERARAQVPMFVFAGSEAYVNQIAQEEV
jgi:DNA modification methylase